MAASAGLPALQAGMPARMSPTDYRELLQHFTAHDSTGPGRGSIDFDAAFAALPEGSSGWFVVEVNVPKCPGRVDSARAWFEWVDISPELPGALV